MQFPLNSRLSVAIAMRLKELAQYVRNAIAMRSHADQSTNFRDGFREGGFVKVKPVDHPPIGYIFKWFQVRRVGGVITYIEFVIVHVIGFTRVVFLRSYHNTWPLPNGQLPASPVVKQLAPFIGG